MIYLFSFIFSLFTTFLYTNTKRNMSGFNVWQIIIMIIIFTIVFIVLSIAIISFFSLFVNRKKKVTTPSKFYMFLFNLLNEFAIMSMRIKLVVKNADIVNKNGKYIMVCNHVSDFDSMIISDYFNKMPIGWLSKEPNLKIPVLGNILYKYGYFAVNRDDDKTALKQMIECIRFIKSNDISYGVFPEGTRNKSADGLLPFRSGSLKLSQKTDCPILVMSIKNTQKIHKNFPFRRTKVILDFIEVIDSSVFDSKSTVEVSEHIRQKIYDSLFN